MSEAAHSTRVLTVRQPWAWLIIHGGKDVENRTWPTKVRGRVLIHAAAGMTRMEYESACLYVMTDIPYDIEIPAFEDLQRGGIIGSVAVDGCVNEFEGPATRSPWFDGPWGFLLSDPMPMDFRPCRGALGFWRLPITKGQP